MNKRMITMCLAFTIFSYSYCAGDVHLLGVDISSSYGGDSTLIEVNPDTGQGVVIGPITWSDANIGTVEALAWRDTTSELYAGSSWLNSPYSGWLWKVNPDSGVAIQIGQAILDPNPHGSGNGGYEALDFSPSGTLYGSTGPDLVMVNPDNGAATVIGSFGGFFVEGMSFDSSGNLWATADPTGMAGADTLVMIDTATAAITVVGRIVAENDAIDGFDILGDGRFIAAAGVPPRLLSVDPQTGTPTLIGPRNFADVVALQEIPEPATLSLLMIGGVAMIRCKRK